MIELTKFQDHTKGPWNFNQIYVPFGTEQIIIETADGKNVIATVDSDILADWALIACAPELLEEVKQLRKENEKMKESLRCCQSVANSFVENLPGINDAISFLKDSKLAEPWTPVPNLEKTVERLKCCGNCNFYEPQNGHTDTDTCKLKNENTMGWNICEKWADFDDSRICGTIE